MIKIAKISVIKPYNRYFTARLQMLQLMRNISLLKRFGILLVCFMLLFLYININLN